MKPSPSLALTVALVLTGLSAGFFFTYEASITLGLAQVDDITYVATFQAINATIRNAWFAIVFFGSIPALGLALATQWKHPSRRTWIGLSLALYIACAIITFAGNVPLNDELASYSELTPALAATARAEFENDWNLLNLVRTLAVVASFAVLAATTVLNRTPCSSAAPA